MSDLSAIVARLEAATAKLEVLAGGASKVGGAAPSAPAPSAASHEDVPASVLAYDNFLATAVADVVKTGKALGNADLSKQLDHFELACKSQRQFLLVASKAKAPAATALPKLLKPLQDELHKVETSVQRGDFFNHMKGIQDGSACLGWVTISPAPGPFINEASGSFLFHGNKILRDYKGKDDRHVTFVNSFKTLVSSLAEYVKEHHRTGVTWNPAGRDATEVLAEVSAGGSGATPRASGGAAAPAPPPPGPPPPPPPPPPPSAPADAAPAHTPVDTSALFAQINQGNVTAGLRKVTDDMKTHKNPSLRAGSTVPSRDPPPAASPAAVAEKAVVKEPSLKLEGKTWVVDGFVNKPDIELNDVNQKQSVFISHLTNSVVRINGKVSQLTINKCKKTGIVFDSVVAAVDIVNCESIQVQCLDSVQAVNVDKCASVSVFLSANSLSANIYTSHTSNVLITTPGATPDSDPIESTVPDQFLSRFVNGVLVTEANKHE